MDSITHIKDILIYDELLLTQCSSLTLISRPDHHARLSSAGLIFLWLIDCNLNQLSLTVGFYFTKHKVSVLNMSSLSYRSH